MYMCDLQRNVGVNNLPKVVTRQRRGRELNSQRSSCKSNSITTRLPNHHVLGQDGVLRAKISDEDLLHYSNKI